MISSYINVKSENMTAPEVLLPPKGWQLHGLYIALNKLTTSANLQKIRHLWNQKLYWHCISTKGQFIHQCLICWKAKPKEKATWGDANFIRGQFPNANLVDKIVVKDGGVVDTTFIDQNQTGVLPTQHVPIFAKFMFIHTYEGTDQIKLLLVIESVWCVVMCHIGSVWYVLFDWTTRAVLNNCPNHKIKDNFLTCLLFDNQ